MESIKLLNGTAEAELQSAIGVMKEALKQKEREYQEQQQKVNPVQPNIMRNVKLKLSLDSGGHELLWQSCV